MQRDRRIRLDLDALNPLFEKAAPARRSSSGPPPQFGDELVMTSSFGAESALLIHMATQRRARHQDHLRRHRLPVPRDARVHGDSCASGSNLNVWTYRTQQRPDRLAAQRRRGRPDLAEGHRRLLRRQQERADGAGDARTSRPRRWLRGIRRNQAETRKTSRVRRVVAALQLLRGLAAAQLDRQATSTLYMKQHDLPYHPLYEKGYASIGCNPLSCTRPVQPGEDPARAAGPAPASSSAGSILWIRQACRRLVAGLRVRWSALRIPFLKMLGWLRDQEISVLVALVIIIGGFSIFIIIADEVMEKDTQTFDERVLKMMRRPDNLSVTRGPPWLHEVGRDFTALGGVAVMSLLTITGAVFLLAIRKYHAMWLLLGAAVGALLLSSLLKGIIQRARPDVVSHHSHVQTYSFPSGHSMLSAAIYLTLGVLLARFVKGWRIKAYLVGVALVLTFLVGVSRVFVGVHYPTDVMAGWAAGGAWAILCWLVARYLQRQGTVEKEGAESSDAALGNNVR